jgi:hypothetical protein
MHIARNAKATMKSMEFQRDRLDRSGSNKMIASKAMLPLARGWKSLG